MAHIQKRGPRRWVARYEDPDGRERARSFDRKTDAEKFLTTVQHQVNTGAYVDPRSGKITISTWAQQWIDGRADLAPTVRSRYRQIINTHIDPRWGSVELGRVSHAQVQAWTAE